VVSDERAGRVSAYSPPAAATPSQPRNGTVARPTEAQTASFAIGEFTVELAASAASAILSITAGDDRDDYRIDPEMLDQWAGSTARLLELTPAASPSGRAEFRAPFLMDTDGRASIAFESAVTEGHVGHRLLIMGQGGRVAVVAAPADLVGELVDAARGAVRFSRAGSVAGA